MHQKVYDKVSLYDSVYLNYTIIYSQHQSSFTLYATDFLKGVTYQKTDDPLLKKIYEKEDSSPANKENKNWKPIDPRQELFAAIRNRAQD